MALRWCRSSWWRNRPTTTQPAPAADDVQLQFFIRALVEYDGTDYHGFQLLSDRPSVQGALERVLRGLTGQPTRIRYAGRTDAGVHAQGQVIAADVRWRHGLADLERAWNALLPADIAVREVARVTDPGFHPRFSARSRVYRYTVWTAPWRSPLHGRYSHHEPRPLDVERMNQAAALLLGAHDFASFGQPTQGDSTVRDVMRAGWQQVGSTLHFEIEANAFLRRMVRTIVGTLLEAGKGQRSVESVGEVLAARSRALAAPPAPACGLCLVEVKY
jgi:tRNA pseudouridine38-40 synthase